MCSTSRSRSLLIYTQAPSAAPTREAEYRQVQKQLLADVGSVRSRQKEALIKDQLRRNLVITRVIRPGYGEVVVYEHEFVNPFATEMVRAHLEHIY